MDRIDAMRAFVRTVDDGGLAAAARRLGRSPAAVTRAIAFLEEEVGARLLRRTTRSSGPTEAGERFLDSCRRILADFDEATALAAGERSVPRGVLTVTGPLVFGRRHVRPVLDAFLDLHPTVQGRLLLLDRVVNLIDEGIDAAIRIGQLPDSSLIATRIGHIRRVLCASPAFLAAHPPIRHPEDLAALPVIHFGQIHDGRGWSFATPTGPITVPVQPRLTVNGAEAAIESAIDGHGVTAVLSYQIADALREGRLTLLLEGFEPPPLPVHLIYPEARLVAAKVRAFVDFAVPRLRALPVLT
ncbi:LysR family transcriptional regulator [Prosthecomicrobium hirschii]|uniref:LysR family transcriptional regulator n=1 Tax=Prosthecodimorpha hirschii TaxID=665126 RepID=UPI001126A12E|nr:LysR family transcriptional regulator [Prosthecomicrobium hirschii]TPQ52012.1 LysR family transcriptional regulator [Prosthecomicrobium hirschii]